MKNGINVIGFLSLCLASGSVAWANTEVVNMASQNNIKRCLPQLEGISNFILKDKPHGTHATWNIDEPDNRMYTTLSSKGYSDGDSHVSVVAAINSKGKCDTYYTETFALSTSCMSAREETYKDMQYVGTLNGKTIVLKNQGGANYYLSPQGNGGNICLVTKRETVFP
ncbi:hypothetical protein AAFX34_15750 [Vibrio vulnificus]|uniref:hypothetical protein n=1 Tax=Vibrio vulnificus TaxID=672 RepID=UPI00397F551E